MGGSVRMRSFSISGAFFLSVLGSSALCSANQMPFEIGQHAAGHGAPNLPFVSVTVCASGTRNCVTVDRIKLDTGSEGLRVFRSALQGLQLSIERDARGADLALCAGFAGGDGDWGPIASADLILGDEFAREAKIQIVDPDFPSPNVTCLPTANDGRNGILGMSTALTSPNGKSYFSCRSDGCTPVTLDSAQEPLNPIAYLNEDNNGIIVQTPEVPATGAASVKGWVIFGIDTRSNNQSDRARTTCHVRSDDFFQANYRGKNYWTKLDSGTNAYDLPPPAVNIPFCGNSSVYLCPVHPADFEVNLLNEDGTSCAGLDLTITGEGHGAMAIPGLGESWGGDTSGMFILGVPFFFGKRIYYGTAHQLSSLGMGPLVAF